MKQEIFEQLLEKEEDILLLDIREPEELLVADTLPGAVNMPMGKVFTEAGKGNLPKDKKLIIFCRTGGRAEIVERELSAQGYDVHSIEGGLELLRPK